MAEIREYLQTVKKWNSVECEENIEVVIPKLMVHLKTDDLLHPENEFLDALDLAFNNFLPLLPLQKLEIHFFSHVIPKMKLLSKACLNEIEMQVKDHDVDATTSVQQLLKNVCEILDHLNSSFNLIGSFEQLQPHLINSLSKGTLSIVQDVYLHCQKKADIYKEMLALVSDLLMELVSKTASSITNFIEAWNKVTLNDDKEDIAILLAVLHDLVFVGGFVCSMNAKLIAPVWKLYLSLATDYFDVLKDKLNAESAITVLSSNTLINVQAISTASMHDSNPNTETSLLRRIKMSEFQIKILVVLGSKYNNRIQNCCDELINLALGIIRISNPVLESTFSTNVVKAIEQQLVGAIDPLMQQVIKSTSLTDFYQTRLQNSVLENEAFQYCLLFIFIVDQLLKCDDIDYHKWLHLQTGLKSIDTSLMDVIFSLLPYCHAKLMMPVCLPSCLNDGKGTRFVSLYELMCVKLSAVIFCFTNKNFHYLEKDLFKNLVSRHFWCRQLANDLLAFMGRCGHSSLCFDHCCFLAKVVSQLDNTSAVSIQFQHMLNLLNRLANFLGEKELERFMNDYPPEKNIVMWSHFVANNSLSRRITAIRFKGCANNALRLLQAQHKSFGLDSNEVVTALTILNVALRNDSQSVEPNSVLDECQCKNLFSILLYLWTTNEMNSTTDKHLIENCVILTTSLLLYAENSDLLEILRKLSSLLSFSNNRIKYKSTEILYSLRLKNILPDKQKSIFHVTANLFKLLMKNSSWEVSQKAFYTYKEFACKTKHEQIIVLCLENDSTLETKVIEFLNQVPTSIGKELSVKQFLEYEEKILLQSSLDFNDSCEETIPNKKARIDDNKTNDLVRNAISALEKNVSELKKLSVETTLSDWAVKRLNVVKLDLQTLA